MKKWHAEEICNGVEHEYGANVYLAVEVDAHIAELEHQLAIRKAAVEAQFRLMERVKELEKALRAAVDWHSSEDDEAITRQAIDNMRNIARRALGL